MLKTWGKDPSLILTSMSFIHTLHSCLMVSPSTLCNNVQENGIKVFSFDISSTPRKFLVPRHF